MGSIQKTLPKELKEMIMHYVPILQTIQFYQGNKNPVWHKRLEMRHGLTPVTLTNKQDLDYLSTIGSHFALGFSTLESKFLHESMLQEVRQMEETLLIELLRMIQLFEPASTESRYFALQSDNLGNYLHTNINYVIKARGRADAFLKIHYHLLQKAKVNYDYFFPDGRYRLLRDNVLYVLGKLTYRYNMNEMADFHLNPINWLAFDLLHQFFDNPEDDKSLWAQPCDLLE